jgi:hypothetical protein
MYCWNKVTSSRVPSLPRRPPMKCFHEYASAFAGASM